MYNGFYYFADYRNFESIITNGIFSKNYIKKTRIKYHDFSNSEVQDRRHFNEFNIKGNKYWIHDFVPLYFVSKTPTLYARIDKQEYLFFVEINKNIVSKNKKCIFTDGNAASNKTGFYDDINEAGKKIPWEVLNAKFWNNFEDGKRKRNAEILIYEKIESSYFNRVIVNNENLFTYFKKILDNLKWKGLNNDFALQINRSFFF